MSAVTPLVGVWIEIFQYGTSCIYWHEVTPLVGVWIEIGGLNGKMQIRVVTPLVGVWIEIISCGVDEEESMSLPLWECGLK